jgi:sensor histidine kinase YesM
MLKSKGIHSILELMTENPIFHFFSILGFCFVGIKLNLQWIHLIAKNNQQIISVGLNTALFVLWMFFFTQINSLITNFKLHPNSTVFASVYFAMLISIIIISKTIRLDDKTKANAIEKEKIKRKSLQNELSALKNQLNPHFLFNSLNSLLFLVREDQNNAEDFIKKLSYLYRYILQSSDNDFVSLEQELKFLESFIYLLKNRHKDSLVVNINIKEKELKYRLPSLSLQILVENAVKHNSISKTNPLKIDIYIEGNYLIASNKIQKRKGNVISTLTGLENLNSRFRLLINKDIEIIKNDFFTVKMPVK